MRLRIAKVDQQAIAQVLRNVPVKALDHVGTGRLVGAHHLAEVFRVELPGQHGGVHQITKQHRQLSAFGLRHRQSRQRSCLWCGGVSRAVLPFDCLESTGRGRRYGGRRHQQGTAARHAEPGFWRCDTLALRTHPGQSGATVETKFASAGFAL